MSDFQPVKHAVSVSEMAQNLNLSRQRLNQLIRQGKMPGPDKDAVSKRPFFNLEKQKVCREIRQTGRGLDGAPILFYAPRKTPKSTVVAQKKDRSRVHPLATYLASLGQNPTFEELDQTLTRLYPAGYEEQPIEEVIAKVYPELTKAAD